MLTKLQPIRVTRQLLAESSQHPVRPKQADFELLSSVTTQQLQINQVLKMEGLSRKSSMRVGRVKRQIDPRLWPFTNSLRLKHPTRKSLTLNNKTKSYVPLSHTSKQMTLPCLTFLMTTKMMNCWQLIWLRVMRHWQQQMAGESDPALLGFRAKTPARALPPYPSLIVQYQNLHHHQSQAEYRKAASAQVELAKERLVVSHKESSLGLRSLSALFKSRKVLPLTTRLG